MKAINNSTKVKNMKMIELESMPAVGNKVSLYFTNSYSRTRSLGNASRARIPAIPSKVIAIFGG